MARFCKNFSRLAPSTQARLTVENDDRASCSQPRCSTMAYHDINIPIVFDSHHHELGKQDATYREAFYMARETWQRRNAKQQCHHSNSKKNYEDSTAKATASDWYYTPFENYAEPVDVVLECKRKSEY